MKNIYIKIISIVNNFILIDYRFYKYSQKVFLKKVRRCLSKYIDFIVYLLNIMFVLYCNNNVMKSSGV